jgi:hypothetical protein
MLHINLTMVIVFVNIMLTLIYPSYGLLLENNVFVEDNYGSYNINDEYVSSVTEGVTSESLSVGSFGVVDYGLLIIDFMILIMNFLIYLPVLSFTLPIDGVIKLLFFIPTFLMYLFAIVGWVRKG